MTGKSLVFEIDDQKGLDDNLASFEVILAAIDGELAALLSPNLIEWSHGRLIESGALLDALFEATAPAESDSQ